MNCNNNMWYWINISVTFEISFSNNNRNNALLFYEFYIQMIVQINKNLGCLIKLRYEYLYVLKNKVTL